MAEVSPSLETIHNEEVGAGKAVSKALVAKIAKLVTYVKKNSTDVIGKIEFSALTEEQFAEEKGYDLLDSQGQPLPMTEIKWVLMKGQNISGSDYSIKTGKAQLANMVSKSAFIRQATSEGNIGIYQDHQLGEVTVPADGQFSGTTSPYFQSSNVDYPVNRTINSGKDTRPRNYQFNIFIKINY